MELSELLAFAVQHNASDLHLAADLAPMIRVDGEVRKTNLPVLSPECVSKLLYGIMSERQQQTFNAELEMDFSHAVPSLARFRVNAFHQRRGCGAVFRIIPSRILSLAELDAPPILKKIAGFTSGLVLVTGPTGSGKSTTLAAMIESINTTRHLHILTIEDPIEFVYESKLCLINQREVKRHTHSFTSALRSALREDPDVILVGELRDLETIRLAMTAAETGHLVFATLHTASAAKTIDRIIDVFPAGEKAMVRAMLAGSLQAVVAQSLIKKVAGGRVAAHEIMLATAAVRNLIREDKTPQLYSLIQTGMIHGMQTLAQSVTGLLQAGLISREQAEKAGLE